MQLKTKFITIFGITTLALYASVLIFGFRPLIENLVTPDFAKHSTNTSPIYLELGKMPGRPARLIIPVLSLDKEIEYVGIDRQGRMDTPLLIENPGWFMFGVRPGEEGSAVINGHSGWARRVGAFDDLHTMVLGDKIYVEDEEGMQIGFVVKEIKEYDYNASPEGVFGSSDGKAHLNLITCGGEWSASLGTYTKRLIVFTQRE